MNRELAKKVADAVLYEGYMLYPYRPSAIKNRQRWSFGILYPPAYDEVVHGTERSYMHAECLLRTSGEVGLHIQLGFLHLMAREVLQAVGDHLEPVASVMVDGQPMESWDEGVERSVEFDASLADESHQSFNFKFVGSDQAEPLRDRSGQVLGELSRSQDAIAGTVSLTCGRIRDSVLKLSIDVSNTTALPPYAQDRDSALLSALLSAHLILSAAGGEFISLLDPPDDLQDVVAACRSVGNFPVLVGEANERDMMLCSPIVLYDYPQIAPESAGDFFDGTEMDEMLTLRVMTLTDAEKSEMSLADARTRSLLERTEASAREQLMRTHGTIRSMRPVSDKP